MGQLKAVIFDHTTLLGDKWKPFASTDPTLHEDIRNLLETLIALGVHIVVVSTHPRNMRNDLAAVGLPDTISYFSKDDMGGQAKGTLVWMNRIATAVGCEIFETLYVGDDEQDWRTAINQSVMYLHANWSKYKPDKPMLDVGQPRDVLVFASHLLLNKPRWTLSHSHASGRLKVRCLLSARDEDAIPSTAPRSSFTLKNIFYGNIDVDVGPYKARDLLMRHILSSLYLEGLMSTRPILAIYPSSSTKKGKDSKFSDFLDPISKLFRSAYHEDLLIRHSEAKDTSYERYMKRDVTILDQANTVCLNDVYRDAINNNDVIIFDDFTTTGMSLDWARTLLRKAGARNIVLVSAGKYWRREPIIHTLWGLRNTISVDPFQPMTLKRTDFHSSYLTLDLDETILPIIQSSFEYLRVDEPYPI